MNKISRIFAAIILVISLLLTASCDSAILSSPSVNESAAIETEQPSPTVQTPPTRRISPMPQPSSGPASAPPYKNKWEDVYIVYNEGLLGVVDEQGEYVLPIAFFDMSVSITDPLVFNMKDGTARVKGKTVLETNGGLYNGDGQKIIGGDFLGARQLNDNLIEACKFDDRAEMISYGYYEESYTNYRGVVTFTGEIIVPFQYDIVQLYGDTILAGYDNKEIVDTYDLEGTLINTENRRLGDVYYYKYSNGIGVYIIKEDERLVAIDIKGNYILPLKYEATYIYIDEATGEINLCASKDGDGYIFDASGNKLFHIPGYDNCRIKKAGDLFIVEFTLVVDRAGEKCFTYDYDYVYFYTNIRVFRTYQYPTTTFVGRNICYSANGEKLPLPDACEIIPVSPNRFIVRKYESSNYQLYTREGIIMLPKEYLSMEPAGMEHIVFQDEDGFGVMDVNGKVLVCGYDWLSPSDPFSDDYYSYLYNSYSWEGTDKDLIYARQGSRSGLIDIYGNWVWSTYNFDLLLDD